MSIFDSGPSASTGSSGGSGMDAIFGTSSNPFGDGSSQGVFTFDPVKLPTWTRWVNIALLAVSVLGWIPVFLAWGTDNAILFAASGYVITPLLSTMMLIIARAQHLKFQKKTHYLLADGREKVKVVGMISAISFLISFPHVLYLANYIGVALQ